MRDWKQALRHQIDRAADEIKAGAYDAIAASPLIRGARITIVLDPDAEAVISYDIDVYPRSLLDRLPEEERPT